MQKEREAMQKELEAMRTASVASESAVDTGSTATQAS
jgi:hypothetical protein